MELPYLLAFCRIALGLVFAVSAVRKAMDVTSFVGAVRRFGLLPTRLTAPAALLILACEVAVAAVLVFAGGSLLLSGFVLAGVLLVVFCLALASALKRRIETSCNCFGTTGRPVSRYAICRNLLFLGCALGGGWASAAQNGPSTLGVSEWGLFGLMAGVFVAVSIQLEELAQLFQ